MYPAETLPKENSQDASVNNASPVEIIPDSLSSEETSKQKPKKSMKVVLILVAVVFILIISVGSVIYLKNKNNTLTNNDNGIENENVTEEKNTNEVKEENTTDEENNTEEQPEELTKAIPVNTYFYVVSDKNGEMKNNVRYVDLSGKVGELKYSSYAITPSYGNRYVVFSEIVKDEIKLAVLDKSQGKVVNYIDIPRPSNASLRPDIYKNSISPDGNKVFILANFYKTDASYFEEESVGYAMYIYEFSSKKLTKVVSKTDGQLSTCNLWYLRWSKDSKNIYFDFGNNACSTISYVNEVEVMGGIDGLYKYDLEKGTFTNLLKTGFNLNGIYLESIDKFILYRNYTSTPEAEESDMAELTLEKGNSKKILDSGEYASFQSVSDVSPDLTMITYEKDEYMRVLNIEGKEVAVIKNTDTGGSVHYSDWIDASKLIVQLVSPSDEENVFNFDLYLFDLNNKSLKRLTSSGDVYLTTM